MTVIECPADLDIAAAETLHRRLLDAVQVGEALEIDGRAVSRVHAATLQLFASAVAETQARGLPLRWREVSPAFLEGASLLGLSEALRLGAVSEH